MKSIHADPSKTEAIADRLAAFAEVHPFEFGAGNLADLAVAYRGAPARTKDAVSTVLMGAYKETSSKEAFALLYELNSEDFTRLIFHHLKRSYYQVDPSDVLQEVFFNVYRYPTRFLPDRKTAFKNWTHSIIRNTALKHSRRCQRDQAISFTTGGMQGEQEEAVALELADDRAANPLDDTAQREATADLIESWRIYLHFYLEAYRCLTPREKRVMFLVEVESLPYREAAAKVEVRVENLKMMVFRARRKIFTIMKRKFQTAQDALDRKVTCHTKSGGMN
ncbi:MAG: RNA polymerase sigma factor [Planctomycetes bacterium]|nr:RNA polymerase sigma factor [Planctomycetota bacterium]